MHWDKIGGPETDEKLKRGESEHWAIAILRLRAKKLSKTIWTRYNRIKGTKSVIQRKLSDAGGLLNRKWSAVKYTKYGILAVYRGLSTKKSIIAQDYDTGN